MRASGAILATLGFLAGNVASYRSSGRAYFAAAGIGECPQLCDVSGDDPKNWTTFHDAGPLFACARKPMLLDFAIHSALDNPENPIAIRGCTTFRGDSLGIGPAHLGRENPSETSPIGVASTADLEFAWSNATTENLIAPQIITAAKQIQVTLLADTTNGNDSATYFSHYGDSVVGVYVGGRINRRGAARTVMQQFIDHVRVRKGDGARTQLVQLCEAGRDSDYVVGIIGDSTSGLSALSRAQRAVKTWSEAHCVTGMENVEPLRNRTVWLTGPRRIDHTIDNATFPDTNANVASPNANVTGPTLHARADCRTIQVVSGDGCGSLAGKCGLSGAQFMSFNAAPNLCSTLKVGQRVCCSAGQLPDVRPRPSADGSCAAYLVKKDDWCDKVASSHGLTVAELERLNRQTWGFSGCDPLPDNINICLSSGSPPMPPPISNAICGPQKPGTPRPPPGTNLADLNPCPLKSCCNNWGQCGTTEEFCVEASLGAPGTRQPGKSSCISNCGMAMVNINVPPSQFISVGYFEAWNHERPCLRMDITQIDPSVTHIHFAFGDVTSNFEASVSRVQGQFDKFVSLRGKKRILAFGGWAASTESGSYWIFREGVKPGNRERLATNLANLVMAHNLDGLDLDWEYPGAPDIPGIPPADPIDGPNYLELLKLLRAKLPGKSLSIAAPASYWYLKAFPIEEIARVVDYIVYMTYDLHGQWDYGNKWTSPGCPGGDCLRSHVNITETYNALAMITKAGVPSYKVIVGISSYGRSFQMTSPGCTGPICTFTGPASGAKPGRCTGVAGYLANAEIKEIIATNPSARTMTDASLSNILIYDDNQWVAYMDADNKKMRTESWRRLNFGGVTDWAVDLESFMPNDLNLVALPGGKCQWRGLTCEHPGMTNANNDPKWRWDQLCANQAFLEAMRDWRDNEGSTNLGFTSHVSNFFHGPENFQCDKLANENGCLSTDKCTYNGQDTGPAAMFILNSFVEISKLFVNLYEGFENAKSTATTELQSFASAFLPTVPPDAFVNAMFNLLTGILTAGVAPIFNNYFRTAQNRKDSTMASIAFSVATAKDVNSAVEVKDIRREKLAEELLRVVEQLKTLATSINAELFKGTPEAVRTLETIIKDGQLIRVNTIPAIEIEKHVLAAYYTYLIPQAWRIANAYPVVISGGDDCTKAGEGLDEWISARDAEAVSVCLDNRSLYYLLVPKTFALPAGATPGMKPFVVFLEAPTGFDRLSGGNDERGVNIQTLVESSVATFQVYGNPRDYNGPPDTGNPEVLQHMYDDIAKGRILSAPGVVNIPVCSAAEAMKNWEQYAFGMVEGQAKVWPAFPCDMV